MEGAAGVEGIQEAGGLHEEDDSGCECGLEELEGGWQGILYS
jgi:hypothetical protein